MFANVPYLLPRSGECVLHMKRCKKNITNGLRIIARRTLICPFSSRRPFTLIQRRAPSVGVPLLGSKVCCKLVIEAFCSPTEFEFSKLNLNSSIENLRRSFNANSHFAVTSIMKEMKSLQYSSPYPLHINKYERLNGK